jgi:hypothetical protein
MIRILIFTLFELTVYAYALRRGGAPERIAGSMMVLAGFATFMLPVIPRVTFYAIEWQRVTIDAALLAGLLIVVALADRFWPIYAAGLHLLTVATHGVRMYDPNVLPIVYTRVSAWLAYPVLIVLAVGVMRHASRQAAGEPEYGWTYQRHRDASRKREGAISGT